MVDDEGVGESSWIREEVANEEAKLPYRLGPATALTKGLRAARASTDLPRDAIMFGIVMYE